MKIYITTSANDFERQLTEEELPFSFEGWNSLVGHCIDTSLLYSDSKNEFFAIYVNHKRVAKFWWGEKKPFIAPEYYDLDNKLKLIKLLRSL